MHRQVKAELENSNIANKNLPQRMHTEDGSSFQFTILDIILMNADHLHQAYIKFRGKQ